MGPQFAPSESFAQPLSVLATSTPMGVDYLPEGIAVVIWSPTWRSSGGSASKHPSWAFSSRSVVPMTLVSSVVLSLLG
jgi:hypothetical protein